MRRDYLRSLTPSELDKFAAEHSARLSLANTRHRISENGLRTRLNRLGDDIGFVKTERANAGTPAKSLSARNVLDVIGGDAMDTSEVAQAFKTTNAKVLRILKELEANGHVSRDDSNVDAAKRKSVSGGRTSITDLVWSAASRDEPHAERMKRFDQSDKKSS